jgi:hypothetical protein
MTMKQTGRTAGVFAFAGLIGTIVAALALPWARYGGIEIELRRMPGWEFYGAGVAMLQLCVAWALLTRSRPGLRVPGGGLAGVVAGIATAVAAAAVTLRYDDSVAIFGHIVPPIEPSPGLGGFLAIAAALASTVAVLNAVRAKDDRSSPRS